MSTPRPWKVGRQQQDGTWCVVTPNHVADGIAHTDDAERYGGNLIAKGLTLENARLVAVAPELFTLARGVATSPTGEHCEGCGVYDNCDGITYSDDVEAQQILERAFTGMPS